MKQAFSLLLATALLFTLPAALAQEETLTEPGRHFSLTYTIPDGAVASLSQSGDTAVFTEYTFADQSYPSFIVAIGASELYIAPSLDALTQPDMDALIADITAEMASPTHALKTSAHGYPYLIVNENTEGNDFCDVLLLHDGYFIQIELYWSDYRTLSPADLELATALVDSIQIMPAE